MERQTRAQAHKAPGGKRMAGDVARALGRPVRLKTWSLIVTLFGDAVLPRGGSISAMSLAQVMDAMGMGAGAVRTAISRLAADGWIERRRQGRVSFYRLSARHQAQFDEAAQRIYARPAAGARRAGPAGQAMRWAIVALPREGNAVAQPITPAAGLMELSRGWYLADLETAPLLPEEAAIFEGKFGRCPDWLMQMLAPHEQAEAMRRLIGVFAPLAERLASGWEPDPLDALALRILLIHDWRRIVLRLNPMTAGLQPEGWPEAECRALVARLYRQLLIPSEAWLARQTVEGGEAMPGADGRAGRFS